MKLYGYFRSSAGISRPHRLELKNLACDSAPIHLLRNEQARSDYRQINPQGVVPAR